MSNQEIHSTEESDILANAIRKAVARKSIKIKKKPRKRNYWDNKCRESKKKVNRTLKLVNRTIKQEESEQDNKASEIKQYETEKKLRHKKLCEKKKRRGKGERTKEDYGYHGSV